MARLYSPRVSLVALVSFLALSLPTQSSAKNTGSTKTIAVFFVAKGKPNPKLYGALAADLTNATPATKIVWGKHLRKVLKKKPEAAITKCGTNIGCIARLGEMVHASTVLYSRVASSPEGIKVQFLVIDVAAQKMADKINVELTSIADVDTQLRQLRPRLFLENDSSVAEIPLDMVLDMPEPDKDEPKETEVAAADPPEEVPLDFALEPIVRPQPEPPKQTTTGDASAAAQTNQTTQTTEIAAVSADFAAPAIEETPSGSPIITYVGIGVAALGVAALGAGGYFGLESQSKANDVNSARRGPGGDTQLAVEQTRADSWAAADTANILFAVGGGLAAIGAGLVVFDLFLLDGTHQPKTSITVGPSGAAASLAWSW